MVIPQFLVENKNKHFTPQEIEDALGGNHQHGISYSKVNNWIILRSFGDRPPRKKIFTYHDRWSDDKSIFFYHGSGSQDKDQDPNNAKVGNKRLTDSRIDNTPVFLFILADDDKYEFIDEVKVISPPSFENDPGSNHKRLVYQLLPLNNTYGTSNFTNLDPDISSISSISDSTLENLVTRQKNVRSKVVSSVQYTRDPYVKLYALRRANGYCQLCDNAAPFEKDGKPYLEVHHIMYLSQGGKDDIYNVCALCPNCHRKMHIINDPEDVKKLLLSAERSL